MYDFNKIPQLRDDKLRSLLTDRIKPTVEKYQEKLASVARYMDMPKLNNALSFALTQDYGTSELYKYYVTHPIRVAEFFLDWMIVHNDFSSIAIEAALIHNALEKGICTEDELRKRHGDWVTDTIMTLTQDRIKMKDPTHKIEYYRAIYQLDHHGQLLKFFDKFDNIYAICLNPDEDVRANYLDEIIEWVKPLGERHCPEIIPYFNELIKNTSEIGYYHPRFN